MPERDITVYLPPISYAYFFNSICFIFLFRRQSIAFLWRGTFVLFVFEVHEMCFRHCNWNLDRPKGVKVFLVETYLNITTHPQKLHLWILLSSSELTVLYYWMALSLKNQKFCSLDWNPDRRNWTAIIFFVFFSIFKLTIFYGYWLEVFRQGLHRKILFIKNWLFRKSRLLFVRSIISARQKISQCDGASCFLLLVILISTF